MTSTLRLLLLGALLVGCSDDSSPTDATPADGSFDASSDASTDAPSDAEIDVPQELVALASAPPYADVGETITVDGSASSNAETYAWNLGDGRDLAPSTDAQAQVSWPEPGRYQVVLTVENATGRRTDSVVVTVSAPRAHQPRQSSTVALLPSGAIAALSTDGNRARVFGGQPPFEQLADIETCEGPRTLCPLIRDGREHLAIVCQAEPALVVAAIDGSESEEVALPRASLPFGVVVDEGSAFVTLQGLNQLVEIDLETLSIVRAVSMADPRGVAVLPDGRIAVTRWRSADTHAEVYIVDSDDAIETLELGFDPQTSSDTESGGVPSYLEQTLVSPLGTELAFPSTQANIGEGSFRSDKPLKFDTSVRAIVSFAEAEGASFVEDFEARKLFDNRGLSAAGVWSSRGDYLFIAMRGSRAVHRLDAFSRSESGTILGTGYAPDGLALSADDRYLFVNATLSRALQVYDVSSFTTLPMPIAELALVDDEPLSAELIQGKRLFNDSADPRLGMASYIACSHCHLDGDSDHRVWDFTDRGEGLRRTPPLFGRTQQGLLHWSGNFDEVQDFENDIRLHFQGRGLLSEAQWASHMDTLGDPKAGLDEDLDALAAYVASLEFLPSPYRSDSGTLLPGALAGQTVFETAGCDSCHNGALLSDSGFESPGVVRLHDVGTLGPGSGMRLGDTLNGLDTPTLHGLWHQPRMLHDGSATLREVLTTRNDGTHGNTASLSPLELADLELFLLSQDGT